MVRFLKVESSGTKSSSSSLSPFTLYLVRMLLKGPSRSPAKLTLPMHKRIIGQQATPNIHHALVRPWLGIQMASVTICSRRKDFTYVKDCTHWTVLICQFFEGDCLQTCFIGKDAGCLWPVLPEAEGYAPTKAVFLHSEVFTLTGISNCWFTIWLQLWC